MKKKNKTIRCQGLCFRCEHRALSLEGRGNSRCECGDHNAQVASCYMFQPAKPVVTKMVSGYKKFMRFQPWMIAAAEQGVELFNGTLNLISITKVKVVLLWGESSKKRRKNVRT